jgi:hypothetical protein
VLLVGGGSLGTLHSALLSLAAHSERANIRAQCVHLQTSQSSTIFQWSTPLIEGEPRTAGLLADLKRDVVRRIVRVQGSDREHELDAFVRMHAGIHDSIASLLRSPPPSPVPSVASDCVRVWHAPTLVCDDISASACGATAVPRSSHHTYDIILVFIKGQEALERAACTIAHHLTKNPHAIACSFMNGLMRTAVRCLHDRSSHFLMSAQSFSFLISYK